MAEKSQEMAAVENDLFAVYHFVDLKEKRKADNYFRMIGVEISHYYLSIFQEPGRQEPVRVHSVFIRNPSELTKILRRVGNNFLIKNMKVETECGPRETNWNSPVDTWINMARTENRNEVLSKKK